MSVLFATSEIDGQAPPPGELHTPMTYEEYLQACAEDTQVEWVDGEAIVFMPPGTRHQRLLTFLLALLATYVQHTRLGEVIPAPFEMRLMNSAREPDLLFVAAARRHLLDQQRLNGPADLVVEIVSPESAARDRADKFDEYQEAGVREYWVVDVREGKERVDFWLLGEDGRYRAALPDGAGVYRSTALTGFWLDTAWLWQEPLPSALVAFAEIANLPEDIRAALGPRQSAAS